MAVESSVEEGVGGCGKSRWRRRVANKDHSLIMSLQVSCFLQFGLVSE